VAVTINSNIAALNAQRRLAQTTASFRLSSERLSSGLRINHASDDAAGLAISQLLNTDSRVFSQGVRNLNDAASLYSIAEGAMNELSTVVTRLIQLSEQSANGTLSNPQRLALDAEAQALRSEYNRISETTNFNGLNLLDRSQMELSIQAGYGEDGALVLGLGRDMTTFGIGAGTLGAPVSYSAGGTLRGAALADANNDGKLDLFSSGATGRLLLGNGDGTFLAPTNVGGHIGFDIDPVDFNNDGNIDVITGSSNFDYLYLNLGNGNGTFRAPISLEISRSREYHAADLNGDGRPDIVGANVPNDTFEILFNLGGGSFSTPATYFSTVDIGADADSIHSADFDHDGDNDLLLTSGVNDLISVLLNNGNGTFQFAVTYAGINFNDSRIVDLNGDGNMDLVGSHSNNPSFGVILGNSNGTFRAPAFYANAGTLTQYADVGDFNSDGLTDVIFAESSANTTYIALGNGDGTFRAGSSFATGGLAVSELAIGDVNGDGVDDLINANYVTSTVTVLLTDAVVRSGLQSFSLRTRADALESLTYLKSSLSQLTKEIGNIGSSQSRLGTATSNLMNNTLNIRNAESRITDVDVASESAVLARNSILQQAGASILTQANLQPSLALNLLRGI